MNRIYSYFRNIRLKVIHQVMEAIQAIIDEIKHCAGEKNCWGKKNPTCHKPVALPCMRQPKVMLVTEQMYFREKDWRRNPKKIPKNWDSSKELLNLLREIKEGKIRGVTIIQKIDELFNGKFLEDFDVEEMSFRDFYWTHFIKCPGNLRNKFFERKGLNLEFCAEKFLTREIRRLHPKAIVCMGKHASSWILKKTGYKDGWTEMLWEEIERIIKNKKHVPEREIAGCNHKAKIIVLPHPSGVNPLATLLNKKLRNLLTFLT